MNRGGRVRADIDACVRNARVTGEVDGQRRLLTVERIVVVVIDRSGVDCGRAAAQTEIPHRPILARIEIGKVRRVRDVRRRDRARRLLNHTVFGCRGAGKIRALIVADDRVIDLARAAGDADAALRVADDVDAGQLQRTAAHEDGVLCARRAILTVRYHERANERRRARREDGGAVRRRVVIRENRARREEFRRVVDRASVLTGCVAEDLRGRHRGCAARIVDAAAVHASRIVRDRRINERYVASVIETGAVRRDVRRDFGRFRNRENASVVDAAAVRARGCVIDLRARQRRRASVIETGARTARNVLDFDPVDRNCADVIDRAAFGRADVVDRHRLDRRFERRTPGVVNCAALADDRAVAGDRRISESEVRAFGDRYEAAFHVGAGRAVHERETVEVDNGARRFLAICVDVE